MTLMRNLTAYKIVYEGYPKDNNNSNSIFTSQYYDKSVAVSHPMSKANFKD